MWALVDQSESNEGSTFLLVYYFSYAPLLSVQEAYQQWVRSARAVRWLELSGFNYWSS